MAIYECEIIGTNGSIRGVFEADQKNGLFTFTTDRASPGQKALRPGCVRRRGVVEP